MGMITHWWNAGRYERECAEFDAAHPLSRQVYDSLTRYACQPLIDPMAEVIAPDPFPIPWYIRVTTEAGIYCRLPMRLDFPGHVGVLDL